MPSFYKSPLGAAPQATGVVLEKIGLECKSPHYAVRKGLRVQLLKNGKIVACFVPMDGCLNFVEESDLVTVEWIKGKKGMGDIPGVRFRVIKASHISLIAMYKGKREKPKS
uniref:Uncharacterized protein n=1 Tax=Arcella intermedia TaxID=1963864 RepID=A0A6B2LQI9_9EUKA